MAAIGTVIYGRVQHRPPAVLLPYGRMNLDSPCPTYQSPTARASGWILMKLKEEISTRVKLEHQGIHCDCESLVGNGTLKEDGQYMIIF